MGKSGKSRKKRRPGLGTLAARLFQYDTNLIVAIFFLMVFGLLMIYSASYYQASMSSKFGYDAAYFLKNQLRWELVGIVFMFVIANVDYHLFRPFYLIGLGVSLVLIVLLKTPLGVTVNGATRWLRIPGLGQFQVAEPIKLLMIVFSAVYMTHLAKYLQSDFFKKRVKTMVIMLIPQAFVAGVLFVFSNNMSTAIIVLGISVIMMFLLHPKTLAFFGLAFAGLGAVGLYIYYLLRSSGASEDGGFRSARIMAWLDPYSYESDKAYQALQALYAIGSGGLFGKGLGNSVQKLGSIPEPYNDMIFSIVCEELGIFGAGVVIVLFMYLLFRIYVITQRAEDLFGRLLCIGVFSHIALQVVLNMMVVTSILPTTGVTLPFFSAGGSAAAFLFMEFGVVLSVDKIARNHAVEHEEEQQQLELENEREYKNRRNWR